MKQSLLLAPLLAACTTLGPMPATTGISAVPAGRPGAEVQAGIVPSFFLSNATQAQPHADPIGQISALIEPDRWLHAPGVIAGARLVGNSGDTYLEPYVGYRHMVSPAVALAGIAYASSAHASDSAGLASYHATRGGGEVALDARIDNPISWLGVHLQGAVSATAIAATGHYCVDPNGNGTDCSSDPSVTNTFVDGALRGVFPAATGTLAFDVLRQPSGFLGARLAFLVATGTMPMVRDGATQTTAGWTSFGLTLALAFGAP